MDNKRYFFDGESSKEAVAKEKQKIQEFMQELLKINNDPNGPKYHMEPNQLEKIAPYLFKDMKDFINVSNNSTILSTGSRFQIPERYQQPDDIIGTYNNMANKGFFDALTGYSYGTGKYHTGSELLREVIEFNDLNYQFSKVRTNMSFNSLSKAVENLATNNSFMAFDLETLGGVNKGGYQGFDTITEFASGIYNKADFSKGALPYNQNMITQNVIGLSPDEVNKYLRELEDIETRGYTTDRQRVLATRFAKYGHGDTHLENVGPGQWKVTSFASDEAERLVTNNNVERGIRKLGEIGAEQRANPLSNGLMAWQEQFGKMIGHMNSGKMPIVGHNSVIADIPWLNQFLPRMYSGMNDSQKGIFNNLAGFKDKVPFVKVAPGMNIDFLALANFASAATGKGIYYNDKKDISMLLSGKKPLTPFQQEALGRLEFKQLFEGVGGTAHTAGFDVHVLANLVAASPDNKTGTLMQRMYQEAKKNKSTLSGNLGGGQKDLLFANFGAGFNPGGREPINFVHDALDESYKTFNAFVVGKDGNTSKELFGQYGIKRNRFYTVDWSGELNMGDEWVKNMTGLHDEYAQQKLFGAKLIPITGKGPGQQDFAGDHQGIKSHTYIVTNSKERLEGIMSGFMKVGQRRDASEPFRELIDPAQRSEVAAALSRVTISDGKVSASSFNGIEDSIKHAVGRDINESAARMAREDSYKKSRQFDSLYNALDKMVVPGSKYKDPKQVLHDIISNKVATAVSAGKTINLGYDDIKHIIGFEVRSGPLAGQQKLLRETLDKYSVGFDYFASQRNVSNAINSVINPNGVKANAELQFKYSQILNGLKAKHSSNIADKVARNKMLTNSKPLEIFSKDLDYFTFKLPGFFKDSLTQETDLKYSVPEEDDLLRISLAPNKEYGLVDELVNRNVKMSAITSGQKNQYGVNQLKNLVTHVRKNFKNEYKGIFNDLELSNYDNANLLAEAVQRKLIDYRSANPTAGIVGDQFMQDVMSEGEIFKHIESMPNLSSDISEMNKGLANFTHINSTKTGSQELKTEVEKMIDAVLMPEFNVGGRVVSASQYASHYGFDKTQQQMFNAVYQNARTSQIEGITKFTEGLLQTGANVMYDRQNKTIMAMLNGQHVDLNNLPRVAVTDGVMYTQLGRNRVVLHGLMDATSITGNSTKGFKGSGLFSPGDVKFNTTLGRAYANAFNPVSSMKRGMLYQDVHNRVTSWIANVAENIRSGASVGQMDVQDAYSTMRFDYKDIYALLPFMKDKIDETKIRDKKLLDVIKTGMKYETLSSVQRETIQKNIPYLLRLASGLNLIKTPMNDLQLAADNISFLNKETQVAEAIGMIGPFDPKPLSLMEDNKRPVINQSTRQVMYRAKDWEDASTELSKSGRRIAIGMLLENPSSRALMNRELEGLSKANGKSASILRVGKLNMSHAELQNLIVKKFANKKSIQGALSKEDKIIFDTLKGMSMMEQESVIDTRLMDSVFNKMEVQKISASKDFAVNDQINKNTLEKVFGIYNVLPVLEQDPITKEFKFQYQSGRVVERMDPILNVMGFGEQVQPYGVKADYGKFKFGYFTKSGVLANNTDITESIKNAKLGASTVEDVHNFLNRKYDAAYYIENIEQLGFKKFSTGLVEKDMYHAPFIGTGKLDSTIAGYLDKSGYGHLKGRVLTKEFFEEDVLGSLSGINKKDAMEAFHSERNKAFETLRSMLPGHDFGIISNHSIGKHGNVALSFEEAFSTMVELEQKGTKGLSEADAVKNVFTNMKSHNVLNMKDARYDSGKVMFGHASAVSDDNIDIRKMKEMTEKLYPQMASPEGMGIKVLDGGRAIGSYTRTSINEVADYQGIPAASSETVFSKMLDLQEQIRNLQKGSPESALLSEKHSEYKSIYNAISKGMKITDREMNLLNIQRYDNAYLSTFEKGLKEGNINQGEFDSYIGHALKKDTNGQYEKDTSGKFMFSDKHKGRSVLSSYTESLQNELLYRPGDDKMTAQIDANGELQGLAKQTASGAIRPLNYNKNVSKEIYEGFLKDKARPLSVEKAEQLYSVTKGMQAIRWNSGQYSNLENMNGLGFKSTSLDKVVSSIGSDVDYVLKNENNIFNNNLLIDLGEHAGATASQRHIALPFTPTKVSGDNLVKMQFHRDINKLIRRKQDIDDVVNHRIEGNVTDRVSKYREAIDEFKTTLTANMTGKNGIAANAAAIREEFSISGKSSFMTPLGENMEYALGEEGKNWKILADKEGLAFLNDPALSKAQFGEGKNKKSLLDWYKQGVSVDARFAGESAFLRMGMFEPEYMKSTGIDVDKIGLDQSKVAMRDKLMTEGIAVNGTRYPAILRRSSQPMMAYLSEELAGNRIKTTATGALAANQDNDGDLIPSAVIRHRSADGAMVDHMQLQHRSSKGLATAEEKETFADVKSSIMFNAIGDNKYYQDRIKDIMEEDRQKALRNADFYDIAKSHAIQGKIYSEFGISQSPDAINKNTDVVKDFLSSHMNNLDYEKRYDQKDYLAQVDSALDNAPDNKREQYKKAMIFDDMLYRHETGQIAKVRKLSIGEVNLSLFQMRKGMELALGNEPQDSLRRNISQSMAEIIEQEVISAKKGNVQFYTNKSQEFIDAMRGLTTGSREQQQQASVQMKDWIQRNAAEEIYDGAKGKAAQLANISPEYDIIAGKNKEEVVSRFSDEFIGTLRSLNTDQIKSIKSYDKIGQTLAGLNPNKIFDAMTGITPNRGLLSDTIWNEIQSSGLLPEASASVRSLGDFKNTRTEVNNKNLVLYDGQEWLRRTDSTEVNFKRLMGKAGDAAGKLFKNLEGQTLAMGALGLAGAYLMAGFVGGNPAQPADTQAYENAQYYNVPQLQDQGSTQQKQQGYVVNVNAKSNRSDQYNKDAVNQAVSGSVGTNVNISMNINNTLGNIYDSVHFHDIIMRAIK